MMTKCTNKRIIEKDLFLLLSILLASLISLSLSAQTISISGKVSDPNGNPIIGANVLEIGSKIGAMTDLDGTFTLNVKSNAFLQISFVGYKTKKVQVKDKRNLDITLEDNSDVLNEVVVVGYGSQKKESVIGAISSINSKDLLKSSSPNISQAIAGRLPGVFTTQTSGSPGSDDVSIYIRGQASFASDNQPLVMVDGVERAFSQISPDDIESISVLKDASATAVYGVRGANGVILVTTKRGKDQKAVVSLTISHQTQSPTRGDKSLNSYQSVKLLEEALSNDGLTSQYSASDIEMYRKSCAGELTADEAQLYPNVDWYNEILRKSAPAQRYDANIQGGTKRMKYFTSLEYYRQDGLYQDKTTSYSYKQNSNAQFTRYAFRTNLDFNLTKTTTLSVNLGTRFEERNGPNITESTTYNEVFYEINHTPGWLFPIKYENGYYGGNSQHQNNVEALLSKGGFYRTNNTISETNFIVNQNLDIITKGLSAKGLVSFDYNSYYTKKFSAGFATYELIDRDNPSSDDSYNKYNEDEELSFNSSSQTSTVKLYMEGALNYNRSFGKNNVTGLFLYDQNDYRYQAELQKRYQGLVGRVTYNYDARYFGEVNAGYNGSENFRRGHRFGFFPSFSVGWMVNNEKFMEKTKDWLDNLKLRASYGEVGNDIYTVNNVAQRFLYTDSWSWYSNDYQLGDGNYYKGIYEGAYPNYNVTWERARKYNFGIESSFLNGKFLLNIDMFKERRKNILTSYLTVPEYVGVSRKAGNLGRTENGGYEIEFKHHYHIGSVNYNLGFNWSHARNKILAMDEPSGKPAYRRATGHPINQFFGLVCQGFITQEDIDAGTLPTSSFVTSVKAGDLKYKDMNGDGYIDEKDVTQIGHSSVPENTYSFTVGCQWKGFDFSAMFSGVSKVSRYFDEEALFAFVNGGKVREEHLGRWDPSQTESYNLAHATYPLLHYDEYGNHNQRESSFFLKNGDFLRLKNIELSYTLPKKIIAKGGMSECRIYVNGNNLFTWDKLHGLCDPESTNSNVYPISKSVNFGINVKF